MKLPRPNGGLVWLVWLVFVVGSFLAIEGIALTDNVVNNTLSHWATWIAYTLPWLRWPLCFGLLAFVIVLLLHWFWPYEWKWQPPWRQPVWKREPSEEESGQPDNSPNQSTL
jgi:hypothetical protein